ncbi:Trypsin-1 [Orchesella cincta]|uniref:Acrosin n=1 Tax=Orchesella cincta TaxID=48709 RepID=A0A1D2N0A1_ORCCI|nr:Trypsin-1 [Orchesella cincta]
MKLFRVSCQILSCMILIMIMFLGCGTGMTLQIRLSHLAPSSRIVNGQNALPGAFPYLVSIQTLHPKYYTCGGAILDAETILTAAHCFTDRACRDDHEDCYKIVAGEHDLSKDEGHEQAIEFSMSDVVIHEYYDNFHYDNDLAIIHLKQPLKFSRFVQSIALIDPNVRHKSHAVIAGWGKNESNSDHQIQILQRTDVKIFTNQYCENQWGDDYHAESMICAGSNSQSPDSELVSDACQGDSGGPLMALGRNGKRYLVGIVSWGWECGYQEYPGLYTKIEAFLEWIQRQRRNQA